MSSGAARIWVGAALGIVLLVAVGGSAVGADRQNEIKARQAFASGRYAEAVELFANLYAETLHPVYLRNIGRCHQKMRQPDKAIESFRDYIAKSKKMPADERKEIDGYIHEMEALRDEQARAQKPPAVEPLPPTATPTAVPPPSATPPPSTPTMSLTTTAPPPAESAPIYTRWWFWTAVGVVVVGGVVAAVLLSSGGVTRPPCTADIMGGCQP